MVLFNKSENSSVSSEREAEAAASTASTTTTAEYILPIKEPPRFLKSILVRRRTRQRRTVQRRNNKNNRDTNTKGKASASSFSSSEETEKPSSSSSLSSSSSSSTTSTTCSSSSSSKTIFGTRRRNRSRSRSSSFSSSSSASTSCSTSSSTTLIPKRVHFAPRKSNSNSNTNNQQEEETKKQEDELDEQEQSLLSFFSSIYDDNIRERLHRDVLCEVYQDYYYEEEDEDQQDQQLEGQVDEFKQAEEDLSVPTISLSLEQQQEKDRRAKALLWWTKEEIRNIRKEYRLLVEQLKDDQDYVWALKVIMTSSGDNKQYQNQNQQQQKEEAITSSSNANNANGNNTSNKRRTTKHLQTDAARQEMKELAQAFRILARVNTRNTSPQQNQDQQQPARSPSPCAKDQEAMVKNLYEYNRYDDVRGLERKVLDAACTGVRKDWVSSHRSLILQAANQAVEASRIIPNVDALLAAASTNTTASPTALASSSIPNNTHTAFVRRQSRELSKLGRNFAITMAAFDAQQVEPANNGATPV